ncbi:MAG TPA: hypothetical protein VKX29_05870 [Brumimicrobium sp.]|nr:hypothetical protein [Brumimicrobium sp.]
MTKEQAHLFFPHSPEDDLEELWEQRFFEQKQFFLTRPPIRKVWEARLKRLSKQFDAYLALTNQKEEVVLKKNENIESIKFTDEFITSFHEFHALRNKKKSILLQAQNISELANAIENWLNIEQSFAIHWSHPLSENNEIEVARSKEPDPMEFLKDLKRTKKLINSTSLDTLKKNYNILSESIKKEVKRLTLLAKD